VTGDYLEARDWPVDEGAIVQPEDNDGASKVALLGQTTAFNLFVCDPLARSSGSRRSPSP